MRFSSTGGYPLVILSHRKTEFIEQTISSLREHIFGVGEVVVVDDSGDEDHYNWLDDHYGKSYSIVKYGENAGYLDAMRRVFEIAGELADDAGVEYAALWEEDFVPVRGVDLAHLASIMNEHHALAQLNLQRQPVYRIERRFGYMQSHLLRGYDLRRENFEGLNWVSRLRPFTTNPGLIRREVLGISWPTREECDQVLGGAEPAMSRVLENDEWYFGWYGSWNTPYTRHVGTQMKSGSGY